MGRGDWGTTLDGVGEGHSEEVTLEQRRTDERVSYPNIWKQDQLRDLWGSVQRTLYSKIIKKFKSWLAWLSRLSIESASL